MLFIAPRRAFLLVLALGTLTRPAAAADVPTDLQGFGKAKFGMSEAQVKTLYPKMQEVPMPTPAAPGEGLPFTLTEYTLANQSFGPLHRCAVTLRFYEHQLTDAQYRCQEPKDKINDYLQKRFGLPQDISPRNAMSWTFEKIGLTSMPRAGVFMIADLARSRQMSYSLLTYTMYKTGRLPGVNPLPTPTVPPEPGK